MRKALRGLGLAALAVLAGCGGVRKEPPPNQVASLFVTGAAMTAEDADALERKLEKDFADLAVRIRLAGYYEAHRPLSEGDRSRYVEHVLYFVKNNPDSEVNRFTLVTTMGEGPEYHEAVRKMWAERVDSEDPRTLANASAFHSANDDVENAERAMFRALSLDGQSPLLHRDLGVLYMTPGVARKVVNRSIALRRAMEELEKAFGLARDDAERLDVLVDLVRGAYDSGNIARSVEFAGKLLALAARMKSHWRYGEAVNTGESVLGKVAIAREKLDEAKARLAASGRVPASPRLVAYGPDMTLATLVMEKGGKDEALAYLDMCGKFWGRKAVLERWKKDIGEGRTPDFNVRF